MIKSLIVLMLTALSLSCLGNDNITCQVQHAQAAKAKQFLGIVIHRTEYREDLTRVYACLMGRPHTSGRIDDITMITNEGKIYKFTDLDGVDPKRYFQWEDDGKIFIEIDFPPMKEQNGFVLQFDCPDGIIKTVG